MEQDRPLIRAPQLKTHVARRHPRLTSARNSFQVEAFHEEQGCAGSSPSRRNIRTVETDVPRGTGAAVDQVPPIQVMGALQPVTTPSTRARVGVESFHVEQDRRFDLSIHGGGPNHRHTFHVEQRLSFDSSSTKVS